MVVVDDEIGGYLGWEIVFVCGCGFFLVVIGIEGDLVEWGIFGVGENLVLVIVVVVVEVGFWFEGVFVIIKVGY